MYPDELMSMPGSGRSKEDGSAGAFREKPGLLPGVIGRRIPPCVDAHGAAVPESIAEWTRVRIGSTDQWMAVRGRHRSNPILLFLHGGPGTPETPLLFHFNRELCDHVTLVAWEARGACRSASRSIPPETMTFERAVEDAIEVSEHLRQRFGHEQIYLAGHSWGALVGISAAQRAPHLYRAYLGIAQPVDFEWSLAAIRTWAIDAARARGNARAVRELERLGQLAGERRVPAWQVFMAQMRWATRLGAGFAKTSAGQLLFRIFLPSPVYSLTDKVRYVLGARSSEKSLMPEAEKRDLFSQVPRLEIPAYFVHGRLDGQVPPALTEEYVRALKAPSKRFFYLEHAAHAALFDEPERFHEILIGTVLAETRDV
jgi:pimeloyl-ACP methyl ester carboxylesterase